MNLIILHISTLVESYDTYIKNKKSTWNLIDKPTFALKKMNIYDDLKNLKQVNKELYDVFTWYLKTMRAEAVNEDSEYKVVTLLNMYGSLLTEYKDKMNKGERPTIQLGVWFNLIKNSKDFLGGLSTYYTYYTSFYMDVYLLYHLLHNNPNKNNVIYAGEIHIINCQKFLNKYGYERKFIIRSPNGKSDQCVPINDTTLPLFS